LPNYYLYEKVIAENSAALMQLIGVKSIVWTRGSQVFLNQFEIQRMCTGVQVMAVFLGIIAAVPKVPLRSRILAFNVVVLSVHLANIGRIAFEIWLVYYGILPWSLVHYPTGLILGIFSVAILIVAADYFIPQIGDMAFSLIDGARSR
jgi:exosortase/archaeosortase family protein